MNQAKIIQEIWLERSRQEKLKNEGKFEYTCASPEASWFHKLTVLAEEFGEVAHAVNEDDIQSLKEELIQTIAVSVAWLESLE